MIGFEFCNGCSSFGVQNGMKINKARGRGTCQCFSKCSMHVNYLGIMSKCQIISRFGWELGFHISNKLLGDADANGLRSSL